jgi:hypothetical protein
MKALNRNLDHLEARGIELTRLADGADRLMQFMMPPQAGGASEQAEGQMESSPLDTPTRDPQGAEEKCGPSANG